jgi:ligand-binding sensor domain-containing protein/signal transduction histidine kinase
MPKKSRALQFAGLPLCLLAFALSAITDLAAEPSPPFIVDSWTAENGPGKGPPDNEIISVVQTHDGYLWLGTLHGLVRFDGIHFTSFNENNTPGLTSHRIVYLFEDKQTNLWVGTESAGLSVIKNGAITNFAGETTGAGRKVMNAEEDASGDIWFYTSEGLLQYHDGGMSFHPGVWRVYMGLLQKWELKKNNFGPFSWGNSIVTTAVEDRSGNLFVGTLGMGVFWYGADGTFKRIGTEQGLSSDYILSLCLDSEGNVWVGTDGGGLDRIKRKAFDTPVGLHPWAAQSLSEDASGGMWVAFGALGMSCWTSNSAQYFYPGQHQDAWETLVDRQQRIWVGTADDGLFLFETNHFVPAPGAEIPGPKIFALFESRNGQLWVGTQKGLGNFDGQKWKVFTTRDGLSENSVRAIAEDDGGNLWIGTESRGLNFFKDGKFTSYHADGNGLPGDDISCLYAEKGGVLWVGTGGHGLARFENGRWARYASTNGLASDSISYIIEDGTGYLWIGSNVGLMRVAKKSLNDFAAGTTNVISCRTYGKADGLPTRECSAGSQPAVCRTPDGKLWFPTIKGLASVNPVDLKLHLDPPLVMIESILVDGREQKTNRLDSAWPPSIIIPPGGEELEIHYTALNFSAPELVRFKCWLEGHETAPTDVGDERIARYPKLPPGHYRFHVEACNEDNVWSSPDAAVLAISVQPQFWQTGWFRVAGIVLILGIVAAIVRYISTQKLKRQLQSLQQRETLEKERARIARDLHDQLGANLTQVALLGEMAEADKDSPAEIESHAQQISQTARETTRSLDEIVWAVNPANDTLDGLVNYAGKYAQEYLALAGLRCRADLPAQLPVIPIPPEVRHNVFLAFKEAVHNVVKHAQASEVWIRLRLQPGNFTLGIEDNGRGMGSQPAPQNRNGLRNMKKRMDDIRGEFSISGGANGGTIVRLTVPVA